MTKRWKRSVKKSSKPSRAKAAKKVTKKKVSVPKRTVKKGSSNIKRKYTKTSSGYKAKPYTKSSLKRGREEHKKYRAGQADNINTFKEYRLQNGLRCDFIDKQKRIVYELKPYNPKSMKAGKKQLDKYIKQLEKEEGGKWRGILDTY